MVLSDIGWLRLAGGDSRVVVETVVWKTVTWVETVVWWTVSGVDSLVVTVESLCS